MTLKARIERAELAFSRAKEAATLHGDEPNELRKLALADALAHAIGSLRLALAELSLDLASNPPTRRGEA